MACFDEDACRLEAENVAAMPVVPVPRETAAESRSEAAVTVWGNLAELTMVERTVRLVAVRSIVSAQRVLDALSD